MLAQQGDEDLTQALNGYDTCALQTGRALCKGLQDLLAGPSFPEGAWTAEAWAGLRAAVQPQLVQGQGATDAQQATTAYQSTFSAFKTAMDARLATGYSVPAPASATNDGILQAFRAATALAPPQQMSSNTSDTVRDGTQSKGLPFQQERTSNPPPSTDAQAVHIVRVGRPMQRHTLPDAAQARAYTGWLLFLSELIYAVIVLALSVILGLQILYLGDDTWGSVQDILVAFTWGFGIHAISRNTNLGQQAFTYVSGKINSSAPAASAST
jgi:hypothetical protein